jgi:tetratricopeptide (TPR) repeat protein
VTTPGTRAVELLIKEADYAVRDGRYRDAETAARSAVAAADELNDPALAVRALSWEAIAARILGERSASLTVCTRALAITSRCQSDPRFAERATALAAMRVRIEWVVAAQSLVQVPTRDVFPVLDETDAWLRATGHLEWRSGVLQARGLVQLHLEQVSEAVASARDALATAGWGELYALSSSRNLLGRSLLKAGSVAEAQTLFEQVLDDDVDASALGQAEAMLGLSRCALDNGDTAAALRFAVDSAGLADGQGPGMRARVLSWLAAVNRAAGDLDAAAVAADRGVAGARRTDNSYWLFDALKASAEVALDRSDLDRVRADLSELRPLAVDLDRSDEVTIRTAAVSAISDRIERSTRYA